MTSLYPAVKHLHLMLIALSVVFFTVRFVLHLRGSAILEKKFLKIAPHVIDTFLLLSGVALCFIINQYPFENPWLTEKIGAVAAYIVLGIIAMKIDRGAIFKIFAYIGAISWLVYAARMAVFKQPIMIVS
ncbi:invasion protein [Shewanella sp. OPT22]|nr:invasion protein [Shewanella sp. OPT22]